MKRFLHIFTLTSLCVCAASVSAQENNPVALASGNEELSTCIATNPFSDNWELSAGMQGLSFFSNQETALDISKSPFASFRTNISFAVAAAKWFTPQIALRTKISGAWGRSVSTDIKKKNAVNYMHLHEDVMINLSNILYDYEADRKWNIIPYFGGGMVRNFTYNENALIFSLGVMPTYRINNRLKAFTDLSINITGDEFDNQTVISKKHDRWITAEIGVTYELGHNRWHRAKELEGIEIISWQETQCKKEEMKSLQNMVDKYYEGALKNIRSEMEKQSEKNRQTYKSNNIKNSNNTTKKNKNENIAEKMSVTAEENEEKAPQISIFFELGSAELTHRSQLVNIKKLVQTAKEEEKNIVVTGYADSQTGNQQLNERLSARRADTIVKELMEMGIDAKNIKIVIGGGVNICHQVPANRRVVVSLEE